MSLQSIKRRLKGSKRILQLYALLWQWRTSSHSAEKRLRAARRLSSGRLSSINERSFRALIRPEHKNLPILAEEEVYKRQALEELTTSHGLFLAALYWKPHDLPFEKFCEALSGLDEQYIDIAYRYVFDIYHLYNDLGEADRHALYIERIFDYLLNNLTPARQAAFERYVTTAPITNSSSMRSFFALRAKLLKNPKIAPFLSKTPLRGKKIGLVRHNYCGEINYFLPMLAHLKDYELHMFVFSDEGKDSIEKAFPHLRHHILDEGSMEDAVGYARSLNLDMAVNTTYMSGNFANPVAALLNERIAPIQLNACGDVTTSGMEEVDHFLLGDRYIHPQISQEFSEKILPAPGIGFYMPPPPQTTPDRAFQRQAFGFTDNDIVLMSNAHMFKLNPEVVHVWMDILARLPDASLLLMPYNCSYRKARFGPSFVRMLANACAMYSIHPARVILSDAQGKQAVMAGLSAADVYLDAFPYAGPTSTIEALALGLPVVTLKGPTYRHCLTSGMLEEMGLNAFVAQNEEDYKNLAVNLATEKKDWRPTIAQALQSPSFFNASAISQHYERIFASLLNGTD